MQRTEAKPTSRIDLGDGLIVDRPGFGAMRITGEDIWGPPPDERAAHALLRRAVELGVDFIDTADSYGPDVSERLIAEALHPYPPGLVVATKGGITRPGPGAWTRNGHPEHLRAACEGSLARLRVERIDLYQLHAVDPDVPLEDSVGELVRLRDEGKIRLVGVSNFSVEQLERARALVDIASVQNRYNIADRESDDVIEWCEREHVAFIPWSPLAQRERSGARRNARIDALEAIARERNITASQALIAWLLARSPRMLPIPGTSSIEHLEENMEAAKIVLTDDELARTRST